MFRGCRTKLSFTGKFSRLDSSLAWPKLIAQIISLEEFRGADRSTKTVKLFHAIFQEYLVDRKQGIDKYWPYIKVHNTDCKWPL